MPDRRRTLNLARAEGLAGFDDPAPAAGTIRPQAGRGGAARGEDRLPWLAAGDEEAPAEAIDGGRLLRFVLIVVVALALLAGAAAWLLGGGTDKADGSLIRAEPGPYKVRPDDPGGKTFAGTGDSSYAVSEGQTRGAALAPAEAPAARATTVAVGVGVQIGTYMDAAAAEAGWSALVQRNPALTGLGHRVVEGRADIGTLYRLQAIAADAAAAAELCRTLRGSGQQCQIR